MRLTSMKNEVKSPLRYPGGKSKAIKQIFPYIPEFKEYREPFLGGGSIFFALKQRVDNDTIFRLNDLNTDLYYFFKVARDQNSHLVDAIQEVKDNNPDGNRLYTYYQNNLGGNEFERAVRFFVLNRITFSGLADSGGFSKQAFEKRFTQSSIERVKKIEPILKNTIITNCDYEKIIQEKGEDVFIFLDPPYVKATKKRLYGINGDLHLAFDHERFAELMKSCEYKWLITYDDSEIIRKLFDFANIFEWDLQYGMNNYKQTHSKRGKELFISNYDTKELLNIKMK